MTVLWLQKVQFSEQIFVLKSPPIANLQTVTGKAMTTVHHIKGQTKFETVLTTKQIMCKLVRQIINSNKQ